MKEVAQLHERLEIERRYGVTRRRLQNYLARLCKQEPAETDSPESERSDNDGATPPVVDMMQHRQRQASIAAILEATFGRFAQSAPDLWDRRAYLLMVGLVYERLAADEQEVTTDELVALSRVLQRKPVMPPAKDPDRNGAEVASPGARPSERFRGFAEAVRAVYGMSLPLPDDDVDPPRPGNNHVSETSGGVGE